MCLYIDRWEIIRVCICLLSGWTTPGSPPNTYRPCWFSSSIYSVWLLRLGLHRVGKMCLLLLLLLLISYWCDEVSKITDRVLRFRFVRGWTACTYTSLLFYRFSLFPYIELLCSRVYIRCNAAGQPLVSFLGVFILYITSSWKTLYCAHSEKCVVCVVDGGEGEREKRGGGRSKSGGCVCDAGAMQPLLRLIHHLGPSRDSSNSKRRPPLFLIFSYFPLSLSLSLSVYSLYSSLFFLSFFFSFFYFYYYYYYYYYL